MVMQSVRAMPRWLVNLVQPAGEGRALAEFQREAELLVAWNHSWAWVPTAGSRYFWASR